MAYDLGGWRINRRQRLYSDPAIRDEPQYRKNVYLIFMSVSRRHFQLNVHRRVSHFHSFAHNIWWIEATYLEHVGSLGLLRVGGVEEVGWRGWRRWAGGGVGGRGWGEKMEVSADLRIEV